MSRPAQQRQPPEYATKADVGVLAAEVRGLREATEAELRAQRESNDARLHAQDQALERLERQNERLERQIERLERQIERLAADHRATVRWIIGSVLASAGLILAIMRFGQTSG